MAKTGVLDVDPGVAAKATELKKEIQRLVKTIVEETDDELFSLQVIDQTQHMLCALKELKLRKSLSFNIMPHKEDEKIESLGDIPQEFRCPLSKKLMCDPVIVSTGQVCMYILFFLIWGASVFWFLVCDYVLFSLFTLVFNVLISFLDLI